MDIQRHTTISNSTNNHLVDKYVTASSLDPVSHPCTSSPLTTKNWIVTLDNAGLPLFGKQLSIQYLLHCTLGFPDCVSSPGDNIKLSPCAGCAAHTPMPAAKKWPAELTLCTQKISLLHALILPTTNECIKHNTTDVSSPFTWANINEIVCSYYNHLNIAPTIESSAAEVFANLPLIPSSDSCYKFFMDGSLINLGTPEVSIDWSWVQIVEDAGFSNSIATYAYGIIRDNPSSSHAETAAIYAALTVSPSDSSITIYTDSQTAINGPHGCSSFLFSNSCFYYKTTNFELWTVIERTIHSKRLAIFLIKVKAHSSNYLNDFADSLANTAHSSSSAILISGLDQASAHDFVLIYDNDIVCESNPRHLFKQFYQTQLMRDLLTSATNYVVNWDFTWFTLKFEPSHDAFFTQDHASRHHTFKFKLFLDDLPTLEKLYMDELTCHSCIERMASFYM